MRIKSIVLSIFAFTGSAFLISSHLRAEDAAARTPVLIELFTSEGCSSCPPADVLLQRLDRTNVPGGQLIVMSEHVNYWDDGGWKDPYDSQELTERQADYGQHFRLGSVYTPQMIVDGSAEFTGSDGTKAVAAINHAVKTPKIPVALSDVRFSGDGAITLHVETGAASAAGDAKSLDVFVAIADESDESSVARGENAGRTLQHVAVVRKLTRVGSWKLSEPFSRDVSVQYDHSKSKNLRVIAFVQGGNTGHVFGSAVAPLAK